MPFNVPCAMGGTEYGTRHTATKKNIIPYTNISASTGTAVVCSLGDIPTDNPGDKLARSNGDVEPPTFSARAGVFCAD